jgi:hypothetical protein
MLDVTGCEMMAEKVWREIRRFDREMVAQGQRWSQADLFAYVIFQTAGINMVPYLRWIGFDVSPFIQSTIFAHNARIPYYIAKLTDAHDAESTRVRANSYQPGDEPEMVLFDGGMWHTRWGQPNQYPYFLELDFGQEVVISGLEFISRQGMNGRIQAGNIAIHPSRDDGWPGGDNYLGIGTEWTKVGDIPRTPGGDGSPVTTSITFDEPVTTRFLRLEVTSGAGGYATLGRLIPIFERGPVFAELAGVSAEELMEMGRLARGMGHDFALHATRYLF